MRRRYSMFRPETHEILRSWRTLAETYDPPRLLLGEAYSLDLEQWAGYFGEHGDELDLAFAFMLTHADLDAAQMRTVVAEVEAALPADAWPCWTGSNHDIGRLATRWANGDDARVRCALMMLLTLRGTPCLYYGDELGLTAGEVPGNRIVDVARPSRDPGRTPMPWTAEGGWHAPVAAALGHEPQRRGTTRGQRVDAAVRARPHRPEAADRRPTQGRLRRARRAGRRMGVEARRPCGHRVEPRRSSKSSYWISTARLRSRRAVRTRETSSPDVSSCRRRAV